MKEKNETKIFFNNFPELFQIFQNDNKETIIRGFVDERDFNANNLEIATNFLNSILTHDKISLTKLDSLYLIDFFGVESFLKMIDMNILEIIDDKELFVGLVQEENRFDTNIFTVGNADRAERILIGSLGRKKDIINKILYKIDSNSIKIDSKPIDDQMLKELDYDLNNLNYKSFYNVKSNNKKEIFANDVAKIIRTANANKALIYSRHIDATNIMVDMEANRILETKICPAIDKSYINLSIKTFSQILEIKEIPNLYDLYSRKIINFDDILRLRNNSYGKRFREWYNSSDYNPEDIIKMLMNNNTNIPVIQKVIRWIAPTVVGIKYPALGTALSFIDSFILDSFIKGWSPNLFLDDKLKKLIDSNIAKYELEEKAKIINKYFPNLAYNDKCPCNSGKVYGKCCGKNKWFVL